MAKDPAVLLYTSDFITGTLTMDYEQIGKYIILLCLQHQKGRITEQTMLKICGKEDKAIFEKFDKDGNGLFYNKRMEEEKIKRSEYCRKMRDNLKGRKDKKPKDKPIGTPTGNPDRTGLPEIEDEDDNEGKDEKENFSNKELNKVMEIWNLFAEKNHLQKVLKLTEPRKTAIINRKRDKHFDLNKIFKEIENSNFLLGLEENWAVSFDFIFGSTTNYLKIIEGQYRNGKNDKRSADRIKAETRNIPAWLGKIK